MSERVDMAIEVTDEAVEEALTDHHLDEVAAMIEQAQGDIRPFENPSSDGPGGISPRPVTRRSCHRAR